MTELDKQAEIDAKRQGKAVAVLQDWSKWLISVNFFAAAGCVIVLEGGVSLLLQPLLIGAVVVFALAVITSALVLGVLPLVIEALPLSGASGAISSIYDHRVWGSVSLGLLVRLQFALLALGALFFIAWVILRLALP